MHISEYLFVCFEGILSLSLSLSLFIFVNGVLLSYMSGSSFAKTFGKTVAKPSAKTPS